MNRTTWTLLLGIVTAGFLSQEAQAQSYSPGPAPIVGDIQTMCVEQYPTPQTRTDVGIGEQVSCWIASWSDTDIYTDPYGNQSSVPDSVGSVTWSVSGPGSIYPSVTYDLSQVTLTIDLVDADTTATVIATVRDSGTLAVDPPQQKLKLINVRIPTGTAPLTATDQPPVAWKPGNANLGASSAILFQVQPNTVNVRRVAFQVPFGGLPNLVWPDGVKRPIPPNTYKFVTQNVGATPNLNSFPLMTGLDPVGQIAGQNFNVTNAGNLQYQDRNGTWKGVNSFSTGTKYQGATDQTQVGLILLDANNNSNSTYGGLQGPWQ